MFDFGSIFSGLFAAIQEAFLGGIVQWITELFAGIFPAAS